MAGYDDILSSMYAPLDDPDGTKEQLAKLQQAPQWRTPQSPAMVAAYNAQQAPPMIARPPAAQPTPQVPSSESTVAPVSSWKQKLSDAVGAQNRTGAAAEQAANQLATAPSEDQALSGLEQQRQARAAALDPTSDQYKPTTGDKWKRGLKAAVQGLASGGILGAAVSPALADYNAPNRQYGIDQGKQAADVASLDEQIKAGQKAYEDTSARGKDVGAAYNAASKSYGDEATGINQEQTNETTQGKDAETARHNVADEGETATRDKNTATNETAMRRLEGQRVGIEGGRLGLEKRKEDYEEGVGVGGSSLPGKAGDLSSVPENLRGMVQAIGEGRQAPIPQGRKEGLAVMGLVNKVYPDYDASQFHNYQATRADFSKGKTGQAINSFNTALTHLGRMEDNLPNNTRVPILNKGINFLKDASGSSANTPFEDDQVAVAGEIGKAYKGGVLSKEEHDQYMKLLDRDASPSQQHSNINELKGLLGGKLDSFDQQYKSGLPTGTVRDFKIVSDGARKVLDRNRDDQIPSAAAKVLEEGKVHTFNNGQQWTMQDGNPKRVK